MNNDLGVIGGQGPSPLPHLRAAMRHLNNAGVQAICIPCNSAHCWHDAMRTVSSAPVFHSVRARAEPVHKKNPAVTTAGVLSTFVDSTEALAASVIEYFHPEPYAAG